MTPIAAWWTRTKLSATPNGRQSSYIETTMIITKR